MNVLCWNRAFVQYDMENPSPDRQDVNQIQQQDDPIELGTIYVVYSICKWFSPIWLDEKSQYPLLHKLISKIGEKNPDRSTATEILHEIEIVHGSRTKLLTHTVQSYLL